MTAKPRLRLPIFWKILLSCLLLSGFLIGGSYFYTTYKLQQEGRGPYLVKHFKRFQNYKDGIGLAVGAVGDVLAHDETLRSALASPAPEGSLDPITARIGRIAELLGRRTSIRPDLLLVFDKNARPLYLSPGAQVTADELRELEAIAKVRSGGAYTNELVVIGEKVYQASGVPITRTGSGEPLGGVLIGVALERYFLDYKEQSDDSEPKQHRLSLITPEGEVLASVLPKEQWKDLGEAVRPEKRLKAKDGPDTIEVLKFGKGEWDFTSDPVSGFMGTAHRPLGSLYLVRTRLGLKKAENVGISIIVGSLAAILIASMLAFVITRPIRKLIKATHEIADGEGDLTKRIEVTTNDETGDLANNVNKLFDNLHKLARDVQGASFHVGASSAEISAASKQMLEGVKDQALKVESSTAAVTELSSSIHHVASNAMETTKAAAQSNTAVQAAMESMASIRSAVEQAAERIGELGESSKRIGNIVEVIRQISEQTSLLALNASIEAAHAGEQGRGFAVVADEVSSLARRVGQSAKDIEDLIATIKDQTADAVRTMEVGTEAVESGTRLVTHTLASLKQITEVIQDTASAVQEQALVSDEIARNMDSVREIANEVLGSSEEAVIQADQLHNLAVQLEESVRSFRLDEGAAPAPAAPLRVVGRPAEPQRRLATRRPTPRPIPKPGDAKVLPGKDV